MKKIMMILCASMLISGYFDINILEAVETTDLPIVDGEVMDEYVYQEMMEEEQLPIPENIKELLYKLQHDITANTPNEEVIKLMNEIGFTYFERAADNHIATAFYHLCKSGYPNHLQAAYDYCVKNYGFNPVTYCYEDVQTPGNEMTTPLHNAILSGRTDNVVFVLEHGGDIFSTVDAFKNGMNLPISLYATIPMDYFHFGIIIFLVEHGANIDSRSDLMGRTVISSIIYNYADKPNRIRTGDTIMGICEYMIDKLGANIHLEDELGYTPFKLAAIQRNEQLAYYLGLRGGVNSIPYRPQ